MTIKERASDFAFRYELVVSSTGEIIDKRRLSEAVERVITLAIEEEREACAKIAEETAERIGAGFLGYGTARGVARKIRARSERKGNDL